MTADPMPEPFTEPAPNMLEAALDYTLRGFPVFPVCTPIHPGRCQQHGRCQDGSKSRAGKVPLVRWGDYQKRLPTEQEVGAWWQRWPTANIGMATGALSFVALDADGEDARKEAMRRGVGHTRALWTGKPGGIHYHYAHPGRVVQNFVRKLPEIGLDFRGDGGYVLLPPSLHELGKRYRWVDGTEFLEPIALPPWLDELLGTASGVLGDDHEPLDVDAILRGIGEGERDNTLWRYACKMRQDGVPQAYAEQQIILAARQCRPPFDESLALEKVRRAYATYTVPIDLASALPPAAAPSDTTFSQPVYLLQSAAEFARWELPEAGTLVDGFLWERQIHWYFSQVNAGKTLLLLALAIHIAAGRPFYGRRIKQASVLFIEEDSSLSKLHEYYETLTDIYDVDSETLPLWFNKSQGLRLTNDAEMRTAMTVIESHPEAEVIFLDSAEAIVPTDRYTSKEGDYLRRFMQWLIDLNKTPVMADHTKQTIFDGKGKEVKGDPMDRLFGGLSKKRVSDLAIYITGTLKESKGITCTFVKARGELPDAVGLVFSQETGFEITSQPTATRTPTERAVLAWFNHHRPADWHALQRILDGVQLPERSMKRAITAMHRRGVLDRRSESDRDGAFYRVNQEAVRVRFT